MQVNVNIDTAPDLKKRGMTMKKLKLIMEEQGIQESKLKRKYQAKVINKNVENCEDDL